MAVSGVLCSLHGCDVYRTGACLLPLRTFCALCDISERASATRCKGQHLHRYEDNFDPVTNLTVMIMNTDKSSVTGWGSPQKFLDQHRYLLGEQVFVGATHLPVSAGLEQGHMGSQRIAVRVAGA
jgi:hypothetical protein